MGSRTRIINGEEITEFAKGSDTNRDIFKQALASTIVEVGGTLLSSFFKRNR